MNFRTEGYKMTDDEVTTAILKLQIKNQALEIKFAVLQSILDVTRTVTKKEFDDALSKYLKVLQEQHVELDGEDVDEYYTFLKQELYK